MTAPDELQPYAIEKQSDGTYALRLPGDELLSLGNSAECATVTER
jgi:hypothetical protein